MPSRPRDVDTSKSLYQMGSQAIGAVHTLLPSKCCHKVKMKFALE